MTKLTVICVDDERDILSGLEYDLKSLEDSVTIELCESAEEATETIDMLLLEGETIALVITDQIMPGLKGTDFLATVSQNEALSKTKAIFLTGQASHEDTINAINSSQLNYYIGKPWDKTDLLEKVKGLLTDYVLETEMDVTPYLKDLDAVRLLQSLNN
jgi:two-component system, chemotaxis family, chemotaxis protein CheY